MNTFDINRIRKDFPILSREVNGKPLIYLDNAATTQKPLVVIDTINQYYRLDNANVHRGVHYLSEHATEAYEAVRGKVQRFINADSDKEIIFVRGATEGINLVAQSYGRKFLQADDEILITGLEHHANIVPWQLLGEQIGTKLVVAPVNENGEVILDRFKALLTKKTKLVAINHISNVLGTLSPIKEMIKAAHEVGAKVLIDGCQAGAHTKIDVNDLNCDFYTFSAHKMFGPTGIGVLYGKLGLLAMMPPYQGGGDMIHEVTFKKTSFAPVPYKFEAGTPNIADTIGFGAAIDYIEKIGIDKIVAYEHELLTYINKKAKEIKDLRIIGNNSHKISLLSFLIDKTHPNDIGTLLDQLGIAVRTGHHCAMPLMQRYEIPGSVRASFCLYNTKEEVDILFAGIERVKRILIDPEPVAVSNPIEPPKTATKKPAARKRSKKVAPETLQAEIIERLRTIYDPEIPVNIYDLGLIYKIDVDDAGNAIITMTLTAPGCPVAETFPGEIQASVLALEGVNEAKVELVWEPAWSQEKMTEAARLELGFF